MSVHPHRSALLVAAIMLAVMVPAGVDLAGSAIGSDSTPAPHPAIEVGSHPAGAAPPASQPQPPDATPSPAP